MTWSFIARKEAQLFGGGAPELDLANPISSELSSMRPGLLPGLLTAVERNRNRGASDVALFELGQAYRGVAPSDQILLVSGVRAGTAKLSGSGRHWDGKAEDASVLDVKADAVAVLASLGVDVSKAQITRDAPGWYHPGRSGTLRMGPKMILAHFGELHPETLSSLGVAAPVSAFEIFLDALPPEKKKSRAKPPLAASELLPVRRDFAFVLDNSVAAGDVLKAAANADKTLISGVTLFDVFEGGKLAQDGKKSLAIEVTMQPTLATLTDKDIEAVCEKVIADVNKATGGEVRS